MNVSFISFGAYCRWEMRSKQIDHGIVSVILVTQTRIFLPMSVARFHGSLKEYSTAQASVDRFCRLVSWTATFICNWIEGHVGSQAHTKSRKAVNLQRILTILPIILALIAILVKLFLHVTFLLAGSHILSIRLLICTCR